MIGEIKMIIAVERKGKQMDDLISRQAAIDSVDSIKIERNQSWYPFYQKVLIRLNNLPSAQRKGKWITKMVDCSNILLPFCSVCNKPLMFYDHNLRPNYCPNCGAEMRQDDPSHPFADDVMMKGEEDE